MTTAFAHFDASHRENFCASVLLLAMDLDAATRKIVVGSACTSLGLVEPAEVIAYGREARLAETDDDTFARVDLWALLRFEDGPGLVFIEVKTHDRWDPAAVAAQVRDQASRARLVRSNHPIKGCVLLAPRRLCDRVREAAPAVATVTWTSLLRELKGVASPDTIVDHAVRHLEEHVERPTGIEGRTLDAFEHATTTVACLRDFLVGCIADLGGTKATGFYTTPGDGQPFTWGGWAWHGISVPFARGDRKHRLGIYKYLATPPGEEDARDTLWLEAYEGDEPTPIAFVKFAPPTLAPADLDVVRASFKAEWDRHLKKGGVRG